jgi:hypothetical protein
MINTVQQEINQAQAIATQNKNTLQEQITNSKAIIKINLEE